jgi:AcrR family transcriptional regulator
VSWPGRAGAGGPDPPHAAVAAELVRHAGRLGPIGADAAGLEELRIWIAGLSSIVHRRSTTLRQWPVAVLGAPAPEEDAAKLLAQFGDALRPRLAGARTAGVDPGVLAAVILAFVVWTQLTRASQMPAIGESVVDDQLAVILGNTLLPDAATPTWQRPPLPAPPDEITPRRRVRQALPSPPESATGLVGLRRPAQTAKARDTVEKVLAAAVHVLRRQGYAGTTVADVVAVAGVSRGSFSAYWPDRRALFQTLAHRALLAVRQPLADLPTSETGRADLHSWIAGWLDVLAQHGPILHAWVHDAGNDIELGALTVHLRETTLAIVDGLLPSGPPAESLARRVARIVMWALLVELPYNLCVQLELLPRSDMVAALALFLERGIPDRP